VRIEMKQISEKKKKTNFSSPSSPPSPPRFKFSFPHVLLLFTLGFTTAYNLVESIFKSDSYSEKRKFPLLFFSPSPPRYYLLSLLPHMIQIKMISKFRNFGLKLILSELRYSSFSPFFSLPIMLFPKINKSYV